METYEVTSEHKYIRDPYTTVKINVLYRSHNKEDADRRKEAFVYNLEHYDELFQKELLLKSKTKIQEHITDTITLTNKDVTIKMGIIYYSPHLFNIVKLKITLEDFMSEMYIDNSDFTISIISNLNISLSREIRQDPEINLKSLLANIVPTPKVKRLKRKRNPSETLTALTLNDILSPGE